ncbi:MAG: thioesterase family protein [Acidobacteria bacterium]|nr:thioesterase family protein [Acidobacteriota bacterium]
MGDFEPVLLADAGAVEPAGDGRFGVTLDGPFTAFGYPTGGYLQCVMASAALAGASEEGATHLHATAVSTNFMAAPELGPATLSTRVRRVGRGASFVHVTLSQGGAVTTESLVTLGSLSDSARPRYQGSTAPAIAAVAACEVLESHQGRDVHSALELRVDPTMSQWWNGQRGSGEVVLWMWLSDGGKGWDPWSTLFATDAVPPATTPLGSTGWVPTLQLTSYVRRVPASEWLRARQWCVVVADGLVDERCELFDDTGELVASSSQLASVRFGLSES